MSFNLVQMSKDQTDICVSLRPVIVTGFGELHIVHSMGNLTFRENTFSVNVNQP